MSLIILAFYFVVSCYGQQQHEMLQDLQEKEKELLIALTKRLGSDDNIITSADKIQKCNVQTNKTEIIRKIDSLERKAAFIISHLNVPSNLECADHCCKHTKCDLAVYENKVNLPFINDIAIWVIPDIVLIFMLFAIVGLHFMICFD